MEPRPGPASGGTRGATREHRLGSRRDVAGGGGGGLERRRIGRAVRPPGSEHVHQLLQPLCADRTRPADRSRAGRLVAAPLTRSLLTWFVTFLTVLPRSRA